MSDTITVSKSWLQNLENEYAAQARDLIGLATTLNMYEAQERLSETLEAQRKQERKARAEAFLIDAANPWEPTIIEGEIEKNWIKVDLDGYLELIGNYQDVQQRLREANEVVQAAEACKTTTSSDNTFINCTHGSHEAFVDYYDPCQTAIAKLRLANVELTKALASVNQNLATKYTQDRLNFIDSVLVAMDALVHDLATDMYKQIMDNAPAQAAEDYEECKL